MPVSGPGGQGAGSKPSTGPPMSPLQPPTSIPALSLDAPLSCLSPLLLFSDSQTHPSLLGRGWETGRRRGRRGFRPDSPKGKKGDRWLEDCAPWHIPPDTSSHLSYFPQASKAFVARVFRSGFNACNSPKSFLSIIYINTPSSVLFFWEANDQNLGQRG